MCLINRGKKCWELSQSQKDKYIEILTSKLAALRAHTDISQEDLANIIGISRQNMGQVTVLVIVCVGVWVKIKMFSVVKAKASNLF